MMNIIRGFIGGQFACPKSLAVETVGMHVSDFFILQLVLCTYYEPTVRRSSVNCKGA